MKAAIFLILFAIFCQGQETPLADPSYSAQLVLAAAVVSSLGGVAKGIVTWGDKK